MASVITKKEQKSIKLVHQELLEIKKYLKKFLLIIPEESLKEYKNSSQIKKTYQKAVKTFPTR